MSKLDWKQSELKNKGKKKKLDNWLSSKSSSGSRRSKKIFV